VDWESPTSAELIFPDGRAGFQVNAGLRIQGGASRDPNLTRKHSLRLLFKRKYGPAKLDFPLFGGNSVKTFDTLTLRAGFNDSWNYAQTRHNATFIRDSFARATVLAMGGAAPHGIFVHLYINGFYWGLYNAVERPDASFASNYFGGRKETWDAINKDGVVDGDGAAWDALNRRAAQGLVRDDAYRALQAQRIDGTANPALESLVDVDNLIDYIVAIAYVGAGDWPMNNFWIARRRGQESTGFKFFMWDAECSFGLLSTLETSRVDARKGVAAPYHALRQNAEFRLRFADRVHRYLFNGGVLYVDPNHSRWDPRHPERNVPAARFAAIADQIRDAIVAESARWGDQTGRRCTRDGHWEVEVNELLHSFLPFRSATVLDQFRRAGLYPAIDAPSFNRHGGHVERDFKLQMTASTGNVVYTMDGSDPRLAGGGVAPAVRTVESPETDTLVALGAEVRVRVPTDGSDGLNWVRAEFDDTKWAREKMGVGYENTSGYQNLIGAQVGDAMWGKNGSAYIRIAFRMDQVDALASLTLRMKYDDGFVAYLNGHRVASANDPEDPRWNSTANGNHPDDQARVFANFDLTPHVGLLRAGSNVLAIHGLNQAPGSTDFLILCELVSSRPSKTSKTEPGIAIDRTVLVRARAYDGIKWSAMNEAKFIVDNSLPLRITEVMYHPPVLASQDPLKNERFEFIELRNIGEQALNLDGVRLAGGVEFDFLGSRVTSLEPGANVLVVRDAVAFRSRYPTASSLVAGEYSGGLGNAKETLILLDSKTDPSSISRFPETGSPWLRASEVPSWSSTTNPRGRAGLTSSTGDQAARRSGRPIQGMIES
jgi:hypothetical protein